MLHFVKYRVKLLFIQQVNSNIKNVYYMTRIFILFGKSQSFVLNVDNAEVGYYYLK